MDKSRRDIHETVAFRHMSQMFDRQQQQLETRDKYLRYGGGKKISALPAVYPKLVRETVLKFGILFAAFVIALLDVIFHYSLLRLAIFAALIGFSAYIGYMTYKHLKTIKDLHTQLLDMVRDLEPQEIWDMELVMTGIRGTMIKSLIMAHRFFVDVCRVTTLPINQKVEEARIVHLIKEINAAENDDKIHPYLAEEAGDIACSAYFYMQENFALVDLDKMLRHTNPADLLKETSGEND